jgi:hypothetical protein
MRFFQHYDLKGQDIDWGSPLSCDTTSDQLNALLAAVKAEYAKEGSQERHLTITPVTS